MAGMSRVELSPAEMARAGTMPEVLRKKLSDVIGFKKGGKVGKKKKQDYKKK